MWSVEPRAAVGGSGGLSRVSGSPPAGGAHACARDVRLAARGKNQRNATSGVPAFFGCSGFFRVFGLLFYCCPSIFLSSEYI